MQDNQKNKNVLDLYARVNKLKYISIDNITNQSVADSIYGSMILALVINSEFKLNYNLEDLFKLFIFDSIIQNDGDTNLINEKDLNEIKEGTSNNLKYIFNCRLLDATLNKLIYENNLLSYEKLYQEVINRKILQPQTKEEYLKYAEIFRFYYLNHSLKNKIRSGWDKNHWNINSERIEKISEHIVGTMGLAIAINHEYTFDIDMEKVLTTLLIHEIGEILIGDITPYDDITREEKEKREHIAIKKVVGNLSDNKNMIENIFEFDSHKTNNSIFIYLCDKLEANLQAKIYQEMGVHQILVNNPDNVVYNNPKIQKMILNGTTNLFDFWYESDKSKFESNPVFKNILEHIKNNNLLNKSIPLKLIKTSE